MRSDDKQTADLASRKADYMLGNDGDILIDEDQIKVKTDRTIINQQAFDQIPEPNKPHTMSPDAFMKSVEKDAHDRAESRRMRKEVADRLMKTGNKHFREKEYEKALSKYNQAIEEIADNCLLYTNRALTCLQLKLYSRVIDDCDKALRLNERNMKAKLYKARALLWLGQEDTANAIVDTAISDHPIHVDYIKDYISRWDEEA